MTITVRSWGQQDTGHDLVKCWDSMHWPPALEDRPTLRIPDVDAKGAFVACAVESLPAPDCTETIGKPYQPPATLPDPSPAGTTELPVASGPFSIGDQIAINPGMPNEEEDDVAGFGSIILGSALQSDHLQGEPIHVLTDSDADGWPNDEDNCPSVANPDQADRNGDGIGNACAPMVIGDSNGDEEVEMVDAMLAAQYGLRLIGADGLNAAAADVNCSGTVQMLDAMLIAQKTLRLISDFPVCGP